MKTTIFLALAFLVPATSFAVDGVGNNSWDECYEQAVNSVKNVRGVTNFQSGYQIASDVRQVYDKTKVRPIMTMTYTMDLTGPNPNFPTMPMAGFVLRFADTCEEIDAAGNSVAP